MIAPQELRIGNYSTFKDSHYDYYYTINGIYPPDDKGITYVSLKGYGKMINLDSLKPFLLTEELLLKCGFGERNYKLELKEVVLTYYDDCWRFEYNYAPIKYLHQLQNLYFALTGQELEIKL